MSGDAASRRGPFARLRIRKKLIVLHTVFSLTLAAVLLVAIRPALTELIRRAEVGEGRHALSLSLLDPAAIDALRAIDDPDITIEVRSTPSATDAGPEVLSSGPEGVSMAMTMEGRTAVVQVRYEGARRAVGRLYMVLVIALLAVYGLVALTLELFVLPQHVYGPIRRMQDADRAVQEGRGEEELIPDALIPADELGDIMRLRNESVLTMRRQERALAEAFAQIEQVATDLRRKNHLLEATRRNLADADRLASLGMMSAGIAHEINTPLAVLKGTLERVTKRPDRDATKQEAELLLRVIGRLERLSESLLDFARARPPAKRMTAVAGLIEDAVLLVRIDRDASGVEFNTEVEPDLACPCDADRMVQVLVNLIRNAVDAVSGQDSAARVEVTAETIEKDGSAWASIVVADNGPGIEPSLLPTLFEPFVSTRLDAKGTGLGLAVAEGIVDEHGGVILAGNRRGVSGARFEIMLPMTGDTAGTIHE